MEPGELAGPPRDRVRVPEAVMRLAGRSDPVAVWRNSLGGLTFRVSGDPERYVKWSPLDAAEIDLSAEAGRLRWAARQGAAVPRVLDQGRDADGSWLVTEGVPAESAVADRWRARPETAALAIGAGLRQLHDGFSVAECPYDWSVEHRLAGARNRIAAGLGREAWSPGHRHFDPDTALAILSSPPPIDAVVCHGDACAPNTLLDESGVFAAHVDLGALGVADRWADLAVAAWSTEWNYGPGYERLVYEGYGVEPDPPRIAYYRLLWDAA